MCWVSLVLSMLDMAELDGQPDLLLPVLYLPRRIFVNI